MTNIIDFTKQRGKFYFGTLNNWNEVDAHIYLFCTTHSNEVPEGSILVDELAPSIELLLQKKAWLDKGIFEKKYDEFKKAYIEDSESSAGYQKALDRIKKLAEDGKEIVLFDDCGLGDYCHLSILKDIIKKEGYRVCEIKGKKKIADPYSSIRW
jgi:uncharacterized protein YeaO (DUF488 family)